MPDLDTLESQTLFLGTIEADMLMLRFLLSLVVSWLKEELADSDRILVPGLDTLDSQTLFLGTIDAEMCCAGSC